MSKIYFLVGIGIGVIFVLMALAWATAFEEEQPTYDFNVDTAFERVGELVQSTDVIVDANQFRAPCPDCICKAQCSSSAGLRVVEGCHIPESYFKRKVTVRSYTGVSNIPTLFERNELRTVDLKEKDKLIPGCFYGFEHEEQEKVHRLLGNYPDHYVFRGDYNDGTEKIQREKVKYLVIGVEFK